MRKNKSDSSRSWSIETKLSEFNRVRFELLKNNFVVSELVKRLKKITDQIPKDQLAELIKNPYNETFVELLTPFRRVATMLQIDWMFLFSLIFYPESGVRHFHEVVVATEPKKYLLEPGLYVRFHPWMTQDEWLVEFQKVKDIAKTMTLVSPPVYLYPEVEAEEYFMKKQKHHVSGKDLERNIRVYLEVESRIAEALKERDEGMIVDPEYTEKSGISVIDRILESLISELDIEEDSELDKVKQAKKNTYYEISARYALPTFSELHKYLKQIDEVAA